MIATEHVSIDVAGDWHFLEWWLMNQHTEGSCFGELLWFTVDLHEWGILFHYAKPGIFGVTCYEEWQNMSPQYMTVELRTSHHRIFLFCILIILNCRHLKTVCARRGFLWSPLTCLKADLPKGTQLSQIPSLGVSSTREDGRWSQEETRSPHRTQTNLSKTIILPTYSSKSPLIFLKNHSLSPEGPASSLSFP